MDDLDGVMEDLMGSLKREGSKETHMECIRKQKIREEKSYNIKPKGGV